ncbi:kinase domain protein [Oesophagostomum dentatum]|uniref:cyclin-dependent kinase n=1 Tax=Oesophagostomum dentatum TaxID=61180 RepID=A0A0B1T0C7_OESDE|nr:kinase domain protein [Oesophagostomum dentatum]
MSRRESDQTPSSSTSCSFAGVRYVSILDGKTRTIPAEKLGYGACRSVNEFQKLNRIGEGTYGIVYRAKDTRSGQIVALKKVRVDSKMSAQVGISDSALREIVLLKRLRHENIVELKEVAVSRDPQGMFLVMEYCEQDLAKLLDEMVHPFTEPQVKCLMQQLFRALNYMHTHYVLHRDLKVSNLLLTSHGILKVADFGLARVFGEPDMSMTPRVITLWLAVLIATFFIHPLCIAVLRYRCPELLFGSKTQTTGIDQWAAGCILGELLLHRPLLPGKSDMEQIDKIISLLGTPTTKIWPELESMPLLENFTLKTQPFNNVKVVFESASVSAIDLLNALFMYDPKKRISAADALAHPFFTERPLPCDPVLIPSLPPSYTRKRRRDDSPQR